MRIRLSLEQLIQSLQFTLSCSPVQTFSPSFREELGFFFLCDSFSFFVVFIDGRKNNLPLARLASDPSPHPLPLIFPRPRVLSFSVFNRDTAPIRSGSFFLLGIFRPVGVSSSPGF